MVLENVLPATAAMILDFTRPQRVHNCPRMDLIKKNLPVTAAIILDFTKLQRVHNCPTVDGIRKYPDLYSSNYPRLHKAPTSSQVGKSGWY